MKLKDILFEFKISDKILSKHSKLKQLAQLFSKTDWSYELSDASNVWNRVKRHWEELRSLSIELNKEFPKEVEYIWKSYEKIKPHNPPSVSWRYTWDRDIKSRK